MVGNYDLALMWLMANDGRKLQISHGGKGGRFYAALVDENGEVLHDGVGDNLPEAVGDAGSHLDIEDVVVEQ